MDTNVCNICTEAFNKSTRTIVKCKCEFECCKKCVKTYLLNLNDDPCCMSCKMKWDTTFLQENFEKKFLTKEYKKHRENVLFEREKGMMQATQVKIEKKIKMEKIAEEIDKINKEYNRKIYKLKEELRKVEKEKKGQFIRKCPNNECRGFLSTTFKCELCNCYACSECMEMTGFTNKEKEKHECKKEILESVKLLEQDSKACPNCASLIYKTEGCDQIFCVECHSVFSWKTLRMDNGKIHNPHYYELQRKTNNGIVARDPLDIECGRELNWNFLEQLEKIFKPKLPRGWKEDMRIVEHPFTGIPIEHLQEKVYISPSGKIQTNHPGGENNIVILCDRIMYINEVERQRFRSLNITNKNLESRIDYLRNKISEEKFKKLIQSREKEELKRQEINNILGMFIRAFTDLFYRLVDTIDLSIINEMEELRKYTNECLEKASKTYNCKKYIINDIYEFK